MSKTAKLLINIILIVILVVAITLLVNRSYSSRVKIEPAEDVKMVSSEITLQEVISTGQGQNFVKVYGPPEKLPPDQPVMAPKVYSAQNMIIYYYGISNFQSDTNALTIFQTNAKSPQRSFDSAFSELSNGLSAEEIILDDTRAIYAYSETASRLDIFGRNYIVQIIDKSYHWPKEQLIDVYKSMPIIWEKPSD